MTISVPRMSTAFAAILIGFISGCSNEDVASLPDCSDLREQTMGLFADESVKPIKIYEPKETFRSAKEVHCSGRASWSDTTESLLFYRLTTDEEGDQFVETSANSFPEPEAPAVGENEK